MSGNVRLASENQLDELRICVERSFNKLRGRFDQNTAQGWIGNSSALDRLLERMLPLVNEEQQGEQPKIYIRRLFGDEKLVVPATDGTKTILDAGDVFTAGIDDDFERWGCCITGTPTPETRAEVYGLVENAAFKEMFGGNLTERFWQSAYQIVQFIIAHQDKLRGEGWANLFPFKVGKKKFVANAYRYSDGQLKADVNRFEYATVWYAEDRYRLVVPQRAVTQ